MNTNILLIVRVEILNIFILGFLIVYDRVCSRFRTGKDYFIGFALAAMGHALMGLLTEISVNSVIIPEWMNYTFHVLFFLFSQIFCLKYFEYALSLVMPRCKKRSRLYFIAVVASAIAMLIMLFSDIAYATGNGTNYSTGMGPTVCYTLGFVMFILSDVILIANRNRISKHIIFAMVPLSLMALAFLTIQILIPEFLFTGSALTLVAIGAFFAVENPVGKVMDRAFIDLNTQTRNRNSYELDWTHYSNLLESNENRLIYVLCDVNGLKKINDTYGHLEGDRIIETTARIISQAMENAYRIYRIGGDEFAVVYIDKPKSIVEHEIAEAQILCEKYNLVNKIELSMAIGYSECLSQDTMEDVVRRADMQMYAQKPDRALESHEDLSCEVDDHAEEGQ